jgi:hypothetical protein
MGYEGLAFVFATFPAGPALGADGAMDVVVVWAGLAHGFETPVGGSGPEQFGVLFGKVAKGSVGGLAAEGGASKLDKSCRHFDSP